MSATPSSGPPTRDKVVDREDARAAIAALVFRYAALVDAGEFEAVAELLRHASVGGGVRWADGFDGVLALYTESVRRYDDGTPQTQHITSNLTIKFVGEDRATATSSFVVLQAIAGRLALQPIISGHYDDCFERHGEEWRFARRHIVPRLIGDVSQHLLRPPRTTETVSDAERDERRHRTRVVERYLAALDRNDVTAIVELYADRATIEDPVGSAPVCGRDSIAEFYEQAVTSVARASLEGPVRSAGELAAFALKVEFEDGGGIQVIDLFRFDAEGKIVEMRAIWDAENIYGVEPSDA